MILKWFFDRGVAAIGLLFLWPLLVLVVILIRIKMPGGPAFFVQKRVGKDGRLFDCHKFRTMRMQSLTDITDNTEKKIAVNQRGDKDWSTVSVAGDRRITPLGATLRHYKLDELPGLWDVLRGKMSFVGPRPDVPGYADQLTGDDRDVLKLRPGITGPATLKYRLEDEMIAAWVRKVRSHTGNTGEALTDHTDNTGSLSNTNSTDDVKGGCPKGLETNLPHQNLPENINEMSDQELAVWYNDKVIYPDKVRLNCYYYRHYSFIKDIQMILCTVLGKHMKYAGEEI